MSTYDSRDIRSGAQNAKRDRDHKEKWTHGIRALPGKPARKDRLTFEPGVDDGGRVRPERVYQCCRHPTTNVSKLLRQTTHYDIPQSRFRANIDARVQLSDPEIRSDYLSEDAATHLSPNGARESKSDGFMYSFDKPGPTGPLPLDVYLRDDLRAKRKQDREDQKDYRLVDENGNELKGSKAWRIVRRPANAPAEEETDLDRSDGGFELI